MQLRNYIGLSKNQAAQAQRLYDKVERSVDRALEVDQTPQDKDRSPNSVTIVDNFSTTHIKMTGQAHESLKLEMKESVGMGIVSEELTTATRDRRTGLTRYSHIETDKNRSSLYQTNLVVDDKTGAILMFRELDD